MTEAEPSMDIPDASQSQATATKHAEPQSPTSAPAEEADTAAKGNESDASGRSRRKQAAPKRNPKAAEASEASTLIARKKAAIAAAQQSKGSDHEEEQHEQQEEAPKRGKRAAPATTAADKGKKATEEAAEEENNDEPAKASKKKSKTIAPASNKKKSGEEGAKKEKTSKTKSSDEAAKKKVKGVGEEKKAKVRGGRVHGDTEQLTHKIRKPHRYRPGTRALIECRQQARSSKHFMPRAVLLRIIRDELAQHSQERSTRSSEPVEYRIEKKAVDAIMTALGTEGERYMRSVLLASEHAGRAQIDERDSRMALGLIRSFGMASPFLTRGGTVPVSAESTKRRKEIKLRRQARAARE